MHSISANQAKGLAEQIKRLKTRAMSMREQSEEVLGEAIALSEINATSFAAGIVRGRFGGVEVAGVSVDLGLGTVMQLMAFSGMAGRYKEHIHNIGNGALSSYFTVVGASVGNRMRLAALPHAAPATASTVAGNFPAAASSRGPLSDGQLTELINATINTPAT